MIELSRVKQPSDEDRLWGFNVWRRKQEIDAVASMLPMARCDLAELLTEADIAMSQQGMGENTLRRWPRTSAISKHVFA